MGCDMSWLDAWWAAYGQVEDCVDAFNCQELGMAIVWRAICLYGNSEGPKAVNDSVRGG